MSAKLIIYDKIKDFDYAPFHAAIIRMGGKRIQYSAWIVVTASTARQIRETLRAVIDSDDRLFVVEITQSSDISFTRNMPEGNALLLQAVPTITMGT